jgi:hypothetical protein
VSPLQNGFPSIAESFDRRLPVACSVEEFITFESCLMKSRP